MSKHAKDESNHHVTVRVLATSQKVWTASAIFSSSFMSAAEKEPVCLFLFSFVVFGANEEEGREPTKVTHDAFCPRLPLAFIVLFFFPFCCVCFAEER